jgi:hypothetical protein
MPAKDNEDAEWVESARAQVSAAHQYPAMRALALDNYDPGDLGDLGSDLGDLGLGLRKGQELLVFDTAPAPVSWLIGESGGRRGLVPATYVAARLTLGYVVYVCVRVGGRASSERGTEGDPRGAGVWNAENTYSRRCSTRTDFTFDTHVLHTDMVRRAAVCAQAVVHDSLCAQRPG